MRREGDGPGRPRGRWPRRLRRRSSLTASRRRRPWPLRPSEHPHRLRRPCRPRRKHLRHPRPSAGSPARIAARSRDGGPSWPASSCDAPAVRTCSDAPCEPSHAPGPTGIHRVYRPASGARSDRPGAGVLGRSGVAGRRGFLRTEPRASASGPTHPPPHGRGSAGADAVEPGCVAPLPPPPGGAGSVSRRPGAGLRTGRGSRRTGRRSRPVRLPAASELRHPRLVRAQVPRVRVDTVVHPPGRGRLGGIVAEPPARRGHGGRVDLPGPVPPAGPAPTGTSPDRSPMARSAGRRPDRPADHQLVGGCCERAAGVVIVSARSLAPSRERC